MALAYSIYRQQPRTKILIMWDGPGIFSLPFAKTMLRRHEQGQPARKFFIVRDEKS